MESKVIKFIKDELYRQENTVELIASENFVSKNVLMAMGSCFTNKYAEGYPDHRYYGGCEVVDRLESYCQDKWREVFHTNYHVNVQPHSGSQANMASYMAVLNPGDTILSMSLDNGGHLTHGSSVNFSGKLYKIISYGVTNDGFIDYEDIEEKIYKYRPKLILAGASAYSREIDYIRIKDSIERVKEKIIKEHCDVQSTGVYSVYIDSVNYQPIFMVDMAHVAGLVATGYHQSPFGVADIITTTTHKTLRGPRGGLIFCKPELAKKIDSAVFPCIQGGPLENIIAAKAVAAEEACEPEFETYIKNVVENSKAMADKFIELGYDVVTGGTDNHMFLIDFSKTHPKLTGKEVQDYLEKFGFTVNKNCVPNEKRKPSEASGIRIGTAAMTTKHFTKEVFEMWACEINKLISSLNLQKEGLLNEGLLYV